MFMSAFAPRNGSSFAERKTTLFVHGYLAVELQLSTLVSNSDCLIASHLTPELIAANIARLRRFSLRGSGCRASGCGGMPCFPGLLTLTLSPPVLRCKVRGRDRSERAGRGDRTQKRRRPYRP